MEQTEQQNQEKLTGSVKSYVTKRVIVGILLAVASLWVFNLILGFFDDTPKVRRAPSHETAHTETEKTPLKQDPLDAHTKTAVQPHAGTEVTAAPGQEPLETKTEARHPAPSAHTDTHAPAPPAIPKSPGVAFMEACIAPLDYELNHRWWGWRPNDILRVTDNINKFQLGVLEVSRRTSVILAERISRTGATASFDPNLENAMNSFMINADQYWFPSAESKYNEGLEDFRKFIEKLERREAVIYTRTDNLIPLLAAYEDLLGSSEENLVKIQEDDGSPVSYFSADDYFFYAKGVAGALLTILEAVAVDFSATVETRHGTEVLHKAIESCHHAVGIEPILITNASPSGILANHRANLAAPISHARFYLSVLIKTLST